MWEVLWGWGGPTNYFDQNVALRTTQFYRTLPGWNGPWIGLFMCWTERWHPFVFCPRRFVAREWTAAVPNTLHAPIFMRRARDRNIRQHIHTNLLCVCVCVCVIRDFEAGKEIIYRLFFTRICCVPTPSVAWILRKIIRLQLADWLAGIWMYLWRGAKFNLTEGALSPGSPSFFLLFSFPFHLGNFQLSSPVLWVHLLLQSESVASIRKAGLCSCRC